MNCAIAIQFLPGNTSSVEESVRIVDEVIAYIDSTGLNYYVGPFETTIEGDFDACMDVIKGCMKAGEAAGCASMSSYVKISYRPEGVLLTTEDKIAKYHPTDTEFSKHENA